MSTNDITGDKLITKTNTDAYRDNFDRIFKKPCQHDWCSDGDPGPGEIMTLTCSRCGKEQSAVPLGYTADELERDNPYNQWMYEK